MFGEWLGLIRGLRVWEVGRDGLGLCGRKVRGKEVWGVRVDGLEGARD